MSKFFKRVISPFSSAATGKIKALLGKILTIPQALARKLAEAVKSPFKNIFGKPSGIADYVPISDIYVSKRLIFFVLAGTAFLIFFVFRYIIPYLEGRLWIPTIVINTEKFHTYEGNARVVSREGALIYKGGLEKGEITGYGTLYDGERLAYEGAFEENNYDGAGVLYYPEGIVEFKGIFNSGEYSEGTLYCRDGTPCFEGTFENNAYKEGKLWYENGNLKFDGLFESGMFKEGALYTENRVLLYEGGFLNGSYDGLGKLYKDGRMKYEGEFAGGNYNGAGKLYEGGATLYEGDFREGLFDGYGKLYQARSERLLYEGEFSEGLYGGVGTLYTGSRVLYTGGFFKGLYNGGGVLYNPQGRLIFSGQFYMGEIDYIPFVGADTELVREAFGAEGRLIMLENTFMLYYAASEVIFEFSFAGEDNAPSVQKIKLLGGQTAYGAKSGMSIAEFKSLFGNEIFTEYVFSVNAEDEIPLFYVGSTLAEGGEAYCIKYDLESVYIRAFAEREGGNIIYYEIGGV